MQIEPERFASAFLRPQLPFAGPLEREVVDIATGVINGRLTGHLPYTLQWRNRMGSWGDDFRGRLGPHRKSGNSHAIARSSAAPIAAGQGRGQRREAARFCCHSGKFPGMVSAPTSSACSRAELDISVRPGRHGSRADSDISVSAGRHGSRADSVSAGRHGSRADSCRDGVANDSEALPPVGKRGVEIQSDASQTSYSEVAAGTITIDSDSSDHVVEAMGSVPLHTFAEEKSSEEQSDAFSTFTVNCVKQESTASEIMCINDDIPAIPLNQPAILRAAKAAHSRQAERVAFRSKCETDVLKRRCSESNVQGKVPIASSSSALKVEEEAALVEKVTRFEANQLKMEVLATEIQRRAAKTLTASPKLKSLAATIKVQPADEDRTEPTIGTVGQHPASGGRSLADGDQITLSEGASAATLDKAFTKESEQTNVEAQHRCSELQSGARKDSGKNHSESESEKEVYPPHALRYSREVMEEIRAAMPSEVQPPGFDLATLPLTVLRYAAGASVVNKVKVEQRSAKKGRRKGGPKPAPPKAAWFSAALEAGVAAERAGAILNKEVADAAKTIAAATTAASVLPTASKGCTVPSSTPRLWLSDG